MEYTVFLPKVKDPDGTYRETSIWWYSFSFAGKRYRGSTSQAKKTLALTFAKAQRQRVERAYSGLPSEAPAQRIRTVADAIRDYKAEYGSSHRARSIELVEHRSRPLLRLLGTKLLAELTAAVVGEYVTTRKAEVVGPRTINIETALLARCIGSTRRVLWPRLKALSEPHDIGRALSDDEEIRLLRAVDASASPYLGLFVRIALLSGMRYDEIRTLTWGQIHLTERTLRVGHAKTSSGEGRTIPANPDLWAAIDIYRTKYEARFGEVKPEWFVFPFCRTKRPTDPSRPILHVKVGWYNALEAAGVRCRFHDLRHTFATKLAEGGCPESVMLSLMGHMSRRMMEHYSHIRIQAKRTAVESVRLATSPDAAAKQAAKHPDSEALKAKGKNLSIQ
jgi:integrase